MIVDARDDLVAGGEGRLPHFDLPGAEFARFLAPAGPSQVQWAVLSFLVYEYPDHQLTIPEVSLAINAGPASAPTCAVCVSRPTSARKEVGFRVSLHRTEVGLLERGARVPRIDTLMKLAGALGVRIDCALLDGIGWNNGRQTTQTGAFTFPPPAEPELAQSGRTID